MTGTLLGPGEGRVARDDEDRTLVIKADLDELALVEFRYAAGQVGPERHVHDHHTDGFYVLDGELTVEAGEKTVQATAGTLVAAPAGVAHTFRNESSADVRFLNIHAPSMGFPEHILGTKDDFDQRDPPPDGGRPASDAVIAPPGDGLKADANGTEGTFSLEEATRPEAGRGALGLYVLDGALAVELDGQPAEVGAGAFVLSAPGSAVELSAEEPVRYVAIRAPAD